MTEVEKERTAATSFFERGFPRSFKEVILCSPLWPLLLPHGTPKELQLWSMAASWSEQDEAKTSALPDLQVQPYLLLILHPPSLFELRNTAEGAGPRRLLGSASDRKMEKEPFVSRHGKCYSLRRTWFLALWKFCCMASKVIAALQQSCLSSCPSSLLTVFYAEAYK